MQTNEMQTRIQLTIVELVKHNLQFFFMNNYIFWETLNMYNV